MQADHNCRQERTVDQIEHDTQALLEEAKIQGWSAETTRFELAGMVLCQYKTPMIKAWLQETNRPVPLITLRPALIRHATLLLAPEED